MRSTRNTESIASVVFSVYSTIAPKSLGNSEFHSESIATEVFTPPNRLELRRKFLLIVVSIGLVYSVVGAMCLWALSSEHRVERVVKQDTTQAMHLVEMQEPSPEPDPGLAKATHPRSSVASRRVPTRTKSSDRTVPSAKPPLPAQTAQVVSADAEEAAAVDLTKFGIVTGKAERFAGGTSSSGGANTKAVHTSTVDPNASSDWPQGETGLARAVSLPERNWRCPWPQEAERLGIKEQVVVLRAVVDSRGKLSSASLVSDPGHGFGKAALRCAQTAGFEPARDRNGDSYAATSPPIRLRFMR